MTADSAQDTISMGPYTVQNVMFFLISKYVSPSLFLLMNATQDVYFSQ
jgi:hypothetical protein